MPTAVFFSYICNIMQIMSLTGGKAERSFIYMDTEHTPNKAGAPARHKESDGASKRRFFSVPNIIGIVLCVLMLPGFIISTTLLFSSLIHPDLPPSCFGFTPLIVETGSMSPMFDENDVVLVKNTDDATYEANDIICFHSGNAYVTHRIYEITADESGNTVYITKGDANNAPDEGYVRQDQILGVYKTRFVGMGKTLLFIQTPLGMILCVFLPILLVLLLFLLPPMIEQRKKQKSKGEESHEGENEIR